MRVVVIFTLVVVLFGGFNWLTARQLVRIHPRRKRIVIALLVAGNAMWLFLPWLRVRGDAMRLIRATLGPPWFAWLCFAIVYSIVILAIFVAWLPFARRVDFVRFARWPSRLFLWTTLVALVAGVYGALVPLRVEHVPIAIDALPAEAEGMRIAVIGDLHVGLFSRPSRLCSIFETARAERPDLVFLAGDLVDDDPFFAPKLLASVTALGPTVPVIGVLGNHEMYGDPVEMIERLRGSRVQLLVNDGMAMRGLWFAGLSDYAATACRSCSRISRRPSPTRGRAPSRSRSALIRTADSAASARCTGRWPASSSRTTWASTAEERRSSTYTPAPATGCCRGVSASRRRSC